MVEIDYEKASNGTANKITVVNNKNYRVVFILENDKVVSKIMLIHLQWKIIIILIYILLILIK